MLLVKARLEPGATPVDLRVDGTRLTAPDLSGPGSSPGPGETLDLDGRLVLPGLWDAHVHLDQWALSRAMLDLSPATSAAEAVELIAAHLPDNPSEVVVAHGFRDGLWPDTPSAALLDAVAPHRPVVAFSGDLHCSWFNTSALQRFSLAPHPTGILRETEFMSLMNEIQQVDTAVLDRWVERACRAAAARGVVGVVDFEIADNTRVWQRRIPAGNRHLRVRCGVWPHWLDDAIERGHRTGDALPGTGGLATVGPLKVIVDGSLGTRTAYCHDPYPGGGYGVLSVQPDELERLMAVRAAGGRGEHPAGARVRRRRARRPLLAGPHPPVVPVRHPARGRCHTGARFGCAGGAARSVGDPGCGGGPDGAGRPALAPGARAALGGGAGRIHRWAHPPSG